MKLAAQHLHESELAFMRENPRHRLFHRKSFTRTVDRDALGNAIRRTIADEIPGLYPAPSTTKQGPRRK